MENEIPVPDCDSDSSEDLPELFSGYTFDVAKLVKNHVIWAEFKGLYWPSLVRDVDKKNKKVRVWYLDSPGKCFKVPFKKVHDFADSSFCKKVKDDAKKHPSVSQKHAEVHRRAEQFIYRRFKGYNDDPLEFFDISNPYFFIKSLLNKDTINEVSNVDVSTENVGAENDSLKENSEDECSVESDVESTTSKCLSELYEEDSLYDDETVDKILSFIASGHVDNYLLDIVNSKIKNERHELYLEAEKKDRIQLFVESQPSIPIKSQKLQNISLYLHNLYKQKIEKMIPRLNEYIISVWLPEAVDKAVSLTEAKPIIKVLVDSCCNNKSNSLLEQESADVNVDSDSDKFSSLPVLVKSSELPIDCGSKVSSSTTKMELSELPLASSFNNELCAPKRKFNSDSELIENQNSNEPETEVTLPSKKKRSSKTLKLGKKTPKKKK